MTKNRYISGKCDNMGMTNPIPYKWSNGQQLDKPTMPTIINSNRRKSSNGFIKFIALCLFLDK